MFKPGDKVQVFYADGYSDPSEIPHETLTEVLESIQKFDGLTLVKRPFGGHTSDSETPSWWVQNRYLIAAPPPPRANAVNIKIKKLHDDAQIPKYQTPGAAGFDLHALEDIYIEANSTKLVKTGLAFEIPPGFELQVRPRSGTSLKTSLRVANSPGTVDSDYRGEVCVIMDNIDSNQFRDHDGCPRTIKINKGDRIAQGVICPVYQASFEEVEELSSTDRGAGGFGSSGK